MKREFGATDRIFVWQPLLRRVHAARTLSRHYWARMEGDFQAEMFRMFANILYR